MTLDLRTVNGAKQHPRWQQHICQYSSFQLLLKTRSPLFICPPPRHTWVVTRLPSQPLQEGALLIPLRAETYSPPLPSLFLTTLQTLPNFYGKSRLPPLLEMVASFFPGRAGDKFFFLPRGVLIMMIGPNFFGFGITKEQADPPQFFVSASISVILNWEIGIIRLQRIHSRILT